ncbi:MAG: Ig-like domain-containing protein, partial [Clostridium sp.]|nr:Ig-like domain-containing protein [Clostridium sp.]
SPKRGIHLNAGETYKLKVTVRPLGKIKYASNNRKVAKVTKDGKIKTLKAGKATITVTANGMKKKVKVVVE